MMLTSSYIESENVMTLLNKNNETVTMTKSEKEQIDFILKTYSSDSVEHLTLRACLNSKDFIDRNFNDQIDALKFFQEVVEIKYIAYIHANIEKHVRIQTQIDTDELYDLDHVLFCDSNFYKAAQDAISSAAQQQAEHLAETLLDEVYVKPRAFLNKSKFKIAA
jgi:hypothetical protein